MELNFTVTNQRIKYVSNLYIVEKSRNYLTAKFSFSGSEWKNVAKTAIFKKDDNVINVLLDENGRCTVPWELITRGTLKVSVFGGDLVTVDTAEVKILKSGYEEGNAPSEPTSDVYAQILAELQSIRDDFITEEMLGQAVEDWLAENVVEALSPADVEKIVYDYLDEHKDELKGEKGAVFTPHVSDEGVMSWTNDGGLENPPPVDLKINVGGEYALLTEAGYSLALSIDSNYVMTISLKNKAGETLDSKHIDFPIESMVVNATYKNGVVTFTLQNGNVLDVDISDLVRGLVPTSRKIAGVDLEDDITADELKDALGMYDEGLTAGTLKPWLYDTENEVEIGVYNGKPVYRKYFTIHVTTTNGLYTQAITDLIPDYEEILNHKMYTTSGNLLNAIYANQETLDTRDWMCYFVNVGGNIISISRSTSQPELDNDFSFMAEYTKTTDLEGSGNNLNPYGIYDAKLDDVKSTIASVSDEVDTVEEQVGKLKYEWTAKIKCATWQRLCYVANKTNYNASYLLHIGVTRTGVIINDVFLVNCSGTNFGDIVKICGSTNQNYSVRTVIDEKGNGYFEIYDNARGATSDTTQYVYCSLIPIETGDVVTSIASKDGTTIPDGYSVAKEILVTKTDFQSDVTDAFISSTNNLFDNRYKFYTIDCSTITGTDKNIQTALQPLAKLYGMFFVTLLFSSGSNRHFIGSCIGNYARFEEITFYGDRKRTFKYDVGTWKVHESALTLDVIALQSDIDAINSRHIKASSTATTGATGNIALGYSASEYVVESAYVDAKLCIPFVSSGNWFIKVLNEDMQPLASTDVGYTVTLRKLR